jgi:hypothetical protein
MVVMMLLANLCMVAVLLVLARSSSRLPLAVLATMMPCALLGNSANFPPLLLEFALLFLLLALLATELLDPTTTPIALLMVLSRNANVTRSVVAITIARATLDLPLLLALLKPLIKLLHASLPTSALKANLFWTAVLVLKPNAPRKAAASCPASPCSALPIPNKLNSLLPTASLSLAPSIAMVLLALLPAATMVLSSRFLSLWWRCCWLSSSFKTAHHRRPLHHCRRARRILLLTQLFTSWWIGKQKDLLE